ncbi:glycosyltransferase family 4 protein [Lentimicrobium sp. S6]|uniref:glycosyltransferase family 4 protein n=1 Tax=Lentimicrobium sp. S6 TaxID=2735872 RepID=UPI00155180DC|nr:glycosyltransferase family 4 protein [Lentimicrobium sp. S6]NPD46505.1 glycosyltransferase family 4 protein [Lentimicrobium sp. S6]
MPKKKVLIFTYYWPPAGGAGVQRWLKFTKYLHDFNIEPIIITVDEKQASYAQIDESLNLEIKENQRIIKTNSFEPLNIFSFFAGKKNVPYAGFANVNKKTTMQTISRFIRGNFFIPDPRKGWNRYALNKAELLIKEENIDIIITTGPPHSTHLIGLKLKKKYDLKWICDMRDPWTDIYYYKDLLHIPFVKKMDANLEKKVLTECDKIVTVSSGLKNIFAHKSEKITLDKIHIIPNGYDESDFKMSLYKKNETLTIAYVGTMAEIYEPTPFFDAFERSLQNGIPLELKLVGKVSPPILEALRNRSWSKDVNIVGQVTHDAAIQHMQSADILLLLIPNTKDSKGILTGKFFEYLAAMKPILAHGPKNGDIDDILKQTKAGELFGYDDSDGMKNKIDSLYKEYFLNQTPFQSQNIESYSRQNLSQNLSKIILSL